MRSILILAVVVLACTACQSQPNPVVPQTGEGAAAAATTAQPPDDQPPCTGFLLPLNPAARRTANPPQTPRFSLSNFRLGCRRTTPQDYPQ